MSATPEPESINRKAALSALRCCQRPLDLINHPLTALAIIDKRLRSSNTRDTPLNRAQALCHILEECVEALKPEGEAPCLTDKRWRAYLILHRRYFQGQSPARIARDLAIQRSTLFLEQKIVVNRVVDILKAWETSCSNEPARPVPDPAPPCTVAAIALPAKDAQIVNDLLLDMADLSGRRAQPRQAELSLAEGLDLSRRLNDARAECQALAGLGILHFWRGQCAQGEALIQQALDLARACHSAEVEGDLLAFLGFVAVSHCDHKQAINYSNQSLQVAQGRPMCESAGLALMNLGKVAFRRGDFDRAADMFEEGLSYANATPLALGLRQAQAARGRRRAEHRVPLLINLAESSYQRGDAGAAMDQLHQAMAIAQVEYPLGLSPIHTCLGEVMAATGNDDGASDHFERGVELARAAECPWFVSYAQNRAGDFYLKRGNVRRATAAFDESARVSRDLNTPDALAEALFGLARVASSEGDAATAKQLGLKSQAIYCSLSHFRANHVTRWVNSGRSLR